MQQSKVTGKLNLFDVRFSWDEYPEIVEAVPMERAIPVPGYAEFVQGVFGDEPANLRRKRS